VRLAIERRSQYMSTTSRIGRDEVPSLTPLFESGAVGPLYIAERYPFSEVLRPMVG
jgi:hypothetical protein